MFCCAVLKCSDNNVKQSRRFIRSFKIADLGSIPRSLGKVVCVKGLFLVQAFKSLFTINQSKVSGYRDMVRVRHNLKRFQKINTKRNFL